MYYERHLSPHILKASKAFPVVLLTGPRQVGKTTLFEHCLDKGRTIVSLDNPAIRTSAQREPGLFFKTYEPPLLIDEVQYAPELFPHIKMIVDKKKTRGLFWLTGSHIFRLMKNVSESLAGRAAVMNLQGLSQGEKLSLSAGGPFAPSFGFQKSRPVLSMNEIYALIWRGSFPGLYADENMEWLRFYDSYFSTYIEKDIRVFGNIKDEHDFIQFLKVTAARTGQLLNYSTLANDLGISVNTVKSWVSLLETSGLVYLLYPYSNNLSARVIKTPKLYFFDTGLAAYLAGWSNPELLENGSMNGAILETYAVTEILKSYWHNGQRPNVYFYRDRDGRELDIVIERNGVLHPIEIKRTTNPDNKDIRHFDVLKKLGRKTGLGCVICLVDEPIPLRKDIVALPLSYL
jgi:predicted AAA+ superfamily ATPase